MPWYTEARQKQEEERMVWILILLEVGVNRALFSEKSIFGSVVTLFVGAEEQKMETGISSLSQGK